MFAMFQWTRKFNQPIGNWNMSKVNRTSKMFYNAKDFNQNISNWNMQNVTSMWWMFRDAQDFNNGGFTSTSNSIAKWNVSNCDNFDYMFSEAANFNIDLSDWCVSQITTTPPGFATGSPLENQPEKHPKWGLPC